MAKRKSTKTDSILAANKWLLLRRSSQFSVLALYLLGPLAGIWLIKGNLSSSLLLDTVSLTEPLLLLQMFAAGIWVPLSTVVTGALIVAVFYIVVGGRSYCSWVCPVNIITDAAYWLKTKLNIKTGSRLSRNTRYWVLAMTIALPLVTGALSFEYVNPVSIVHRSLIFSMGLGWLMIAAIFLFDLLVSSRGWCSHLCPMGASYSLLGSASLVRVRADNRSQCDDKCHDCFQVCPEAQVITPALRGASQTSPVILSGNCTNCGRCIDVCPEDVFHFGFRFNNKGNAKELTNPSLELVKNTKTLEGSLHDNKTSEKKYAI